MMLSVLIPTHNYDVLPLVTLLQQQKQQLLCTGVEVEIIVADDASTDKTVVECLKNEQERQGYSLLIAQENMGRSAVRNWLASQAKGDKLLFLDADAMPLSAHFLQEMLDASQKAEVVCATIVGFDQCPGQEVSLRWNYDRIGLQRLHATEHHRNPYASFSTFCFLVSRKTFKQTGGFNKRFKGYGHEDTFFGRQLSEAHMSISHIPSQVRHCGLESNAVFLHKTRLANETLVCHRRVLEKDSRLLQWAKKVERLGLVPLLSWLYGGLSVSMEQRLCHASMPSFRLFQFYKLLHLCHLLDQVKRTGR